MILDIEKTVQQKRCRFYNFVRVEYYRKSDKIVLLPCCTLTPKFELEPFVWEPEYFINNVNECLEIYKNKNMSVLDRFYNGRCAYCTYNDKFNRICINYEGNYELEKVENSILKSCNLHCIMCSARDEYNEKEVYLYNRLYEELDKKYQINTTAHGETFLYKKQLYDVVLPKFPKINILTNGMLINDDDIEKLSKYKDKLEISFSFDSDIKEIYEKIRVGANFEKVYGNLIKLKKAGLLLDVYFVIQELNKSTCLDTMERLEKEGIITRFIIKDGNPLENLDIFSEKEKQIIFNTENF